MVVGWHGFWPNFNVFLILPLALFLFSKYRREPSRAMGYLVFIVTFSFAEGAYFKFPSMPYLDKDVMPYFSGVIACLIYASKPFFKARPGFGLEGFLVIGGLGGIMTALNNPDVLVYGDWEITIIPGLTINDGLFMFGTDLVTFVFPYFLGRALFTTSSDLRLMVGLMGLTGILHIIPVLIEIRFSPQLHHWIYGYMAHMDFLQTRRWGGYRPMVFMEHGLALALFMLNANVALNVLYKAKVAFWTPFRMKQKHMLWFMLFIFVVCKSTGAIMYAMVLLPVVIYTKPRTIVRVAVILSVIASVYPALRATGAVPVDDIIQFAKSISEDRAESLEFRFKNEEILVAKAQERPMFGWGTYGRNAIYSESQGKSISVTDGLWIILFSMRGIWGMVGFFIAVTVPILQATKRLRKMQDKQDQTLFAGLCLMVSITIFDLIPNGLYSPYVLVLAGAVSGIGYGLTTPAAIRAGKAKRAAQLAAREAGHVLPGDARAPR